MEMWLSSIATVSVQRLKHPVRSNMIFGAFGLLKYCQDARKQGFVFHLSLSLLCCPFLPPIATMVHLR
jgi:hypothetical protein